MYRSIDLSISLSICPYEARSKFVVKRKCVMKLVRPQSFYRVWCLDDFSSQLGLAKLIAAIEKYWFQGLLKLVLVGSFFWGSLSRRAQQLIVPEFANHLAGERAGIMIQRSFPQSKERLLLLGLGWGSKHKAFVAISFFHVLNLRFAF